MTALAHRPISDEDGYVLLLVSPRAELSKDQKVPRDIVFVVDTSGSMMHDEKMDQAKKALHHCLGSLSTDDRFALVSFATTVSSYREKLAPVNDEQIKRAKGWVADLYSGGGTAIHEALKKALSMRTDDPDRMFTVVFFTDGQPTIGETDTEKILADLTQDKMANTRIFSFGLGTDLNAVFLDQIAEKTRALSRYVSAKEKACAKIGIYSDDNRLPADTTQDELLALVDQMNNDPKINGILVQLPLPKQINEAAILIAIDPDKDVDGRSICKTCRSGISGD